MRKIEEIGERREIFRSSDRSRARDLEREEGV